MFGAAIWRPLCVLSGREVKERLRNACEAVIMKSMPVQITVRNVPEGVRDQLAARAALRGMSMQEYLRSELERLASRPSIDTWLDEVRRRKRAAGTRLEARSLVEHRDADRR